MAFAFRGGGHPSNFSPRIPISDAQNPVVGSTRLHDIARWRHEVFGFREPTARRPKIAGAWSLPIEPPLAAICKKFISTATKRRSHVEASHWVNPVLNTLITSPFSAGERKCNAYIFGISRLYNESGTWYFVCADMTSNKGRGGWRGRKISTQCVVVYDALTWFCDNFPIIWMIVVDRKNRCNSGSTINDNTWCTAKLLFLDRWFEQNHQFLVYCISFKSCFKVKPYCHVTPCAAWIWCSV